MLEAVNLTRRLATLRSMVLLGASGCATALAAAPASAASSVSANWAGYVATPAATGARFTRVAGSWTEPRATCAGGEAYSAAWVGLGGYAHGATALEQIGTDADCTRSGHPRYTAWFELLPKAPVAVRIAIEPGDEVTASVTVHGSAVTLRLADLTSGRRFATERRLSSVDLSSAEWIVEAPSLCDGDRDCQTLPLADFGTVSFSSASATLAHHASTLAQPAWSLTELLLRQVTGSMRGSAQSVRPVATSLRSAMPSTVQSEDGAFSVSWSEGSGGATEAPSPPTLPGFGGGAPP